MHLVGRIDWSFADDPAADLGDVLRPRPAVLVGREQGAVHTELAVGALRARRLARAPRPLVRGGPVRPRRASSLLEIDGARPPPRRGRLRADADRDVARARECRQDRLGSLAVGEHAAAARPRRRAAGTRSSRAAPSTPRHASPGRPPGPRFGDPTPASSGHYDGHAAAGRGARASTTRPAAGSPSGMDTALLAYSGISVKMLVDRGFGADLLTMFTVDYEPGGAAQAHDHPFEEAYFFLDGRGRGRARRHALHAPRRATWCSRRRQRPRVLQRRAPSACAGSRRRRRSHRPATRTAGCRPGSGSRRSKDGTGRPGTVVVVGGTRAIGLELARHYAGQGDEVVITGQDAGNVEAAVEGLRAAAGTVRGLTFDLADPHEHRRRRSRTSGPSAARARRDRPRPEQRRRLRHRPGDPARDPQARRLHRGRPRAAGPADRRARRSCCSAAWRRSGRTRARPRSRRSTAASWA